MKNIKFRAYIPNLKWMVPVERISFDVETVEVDLSDGYGDLAEYEFDEVVLMQYTGLKDDSGNEIYDGDMVEVQSEIETKTSYKSEVIITHNGALVKNHPAHVKLGSNGHRNLSSYCDYGFGGKYNVSCKIIGNIYENPELLEVQDERD